MINEKQLNDALKDYIGINPEIKVTQDEDLRVRITSKNLAEEIPFKLFDDMRIIEFGQTRSDSNVGQRIHLDYRYKYKNGSNGHYLGTAIFDKNGDFINLET